jgi:anti-anti-sigma factor
VELLDEMTITATDPDRGKLTVTGGVDGANAARLRQAIVDAGIHSEGEVEVDLAGVTFMDSTGLRALADASTELGSLELVLCCVPRQVSRILEVTGICTGIEVRSGEGL